MSSFDLSSLNPEQREGATWPGGPLMILAGAGSGKTRVIVSRIAWLARVAGVPSESILAVTFTNKAAREMQERVSQMLPGLAKDARPTVCTFHAFSVRLLRAHIDKLGYRREFVIFDTQDQMSIVRTIMEEGDYDQVLLPPKNAVPALSHAKSVGLTPALLMERTDSYSDVMLGRLMGEYQQALKRMNALDFEDLLILSLRLAREFPEEAQGFFRRYQHVLVDEYQDTNRAQYDLLRLLTSRHSNLCVVGDDDQSIYRWRGAEPGNILDFERDFPGAHVVRLERNYRSTDTILAAANQVIVRNLNRKAKQLRGTQGPGRPIEWLLGEDERDELEKVVTHLKLGRQREERSLADYAILYRSNHQSRGIEELLREHGVPYLLVGAIRFYERKEVKDALAYLRLIANPTDEVSLFRVLNFPRRGIGQASQYKLAEYAAHQGRGCVDVMRQADLFHDFAGQVATSMQRFTQMLDRYAQRFAAEPLGAVFRDLIAELDFAAAIGKEVQDPKAKERAMALVTELAIAIDTYGRNHENATLRDYLEHVALFTLIDDQADKRTPMVTLMTVHSAKGLEFPCVYVVNLADDIFPHHRALAEGAEEEERRLFYVAVTRARQHLVLSMARQRKRFGEAIRQQPSRFVLEIGASLFDGNAPHAGEGATPEVRENRTLRARSKFFDELRKRQEAAAAASGAEESSDSVALEVCVDAPTPSPDEAVIEIVGETVPEPASSVAPDSGSEAVFESPVDASEWPSDASNAEEYIVGEGAPLAEIEPALPMEPAPLPPIVEAAPVEASRSPALPVELEPIAVEDPSIALPVAVTPAQGSESEALIGGADPDEPLDPYAVESLAAWTLAQAAAGANFAEPTRLEDTSEDSPGLRELFEIHEAEPPTEAPGVGEPEPELIPVPEAPPVQVEMPASPRAGAKLLAEALAERGGTVQLSFADTAPELFPELPIGQATAPRDPNGKAKAAAPALPESSGTEDPVVSPSHGGTAD